MSRKSKNEYRTHLELVDQRTEDQRWQEEALLKLAPSPASARRSRHSASASRPRRRVGSSACCAS